MTTFGPVVFLAASEGSQFGDAGEAGVAHDGAGHLGLVGGAVELVLGAVVRLEIWLEKSPEEKS